MAKKLRLIKTSIYVKQDQFIRLNNVDFDGLQKILKQFFSKKGNGKDCVSIVRAFPTLATSNTIDIELAAFREDIDFINKTDIIDDIADAIKDFIGLEFAYLTVKQNHESLEIRGVFD